MGTVTVHHLNTEEYRVPGTPHVCNAMCGERQTATCTYKACGHTRTYIVTRGIPNHDYDYSDPGLCHDCESWEEEE